MAIDVRQYDDDVGAFHECSEGFPAAAVHVAAVALELVSTRFRERG
jgi:hypothetical protein